MIAPAFLYAIIMCNVKWWQIHLLKMFAVGPKWSMVADYLTTNTVWCPRLLSARWPWRPFFKRVRGVASEKIPVEHRDAVE